MDLNLPVISCSNEVGKLNCGACCMMCGRPPFDGFIQDRIGHPCIELNLSTNQCMIYKDRPQKCRDVEVGGAFCKISRKLQNI